MAREIDLLITHFVKELEEKSTINFAGAGLSTSTGFVNWNELIKPVAENLNLDMS